jgi:hypothetical protein
MRRPEHVACIGGERNACRVLVRKAERNSPLGKRRHRWDVNIAMSAASHEFGLSVSKYAQMAVCCESCNKMWGIS